MSIKSRTAVLAAAALLATGSLTFAQDAKMGPELEAVTMTPGEAAEVASFGSPENYRYRIAAKRTCR